MKVFIDENLPPQFAEALNLLQAPLNVDEETYEIVSLQDEFGKGAKDEDWIPKVGEQGGIVLTQDYNIRRTRHQRELTEKHGVIMVYLRLPKGGLKYWEIVRVIINKWDALKKEIRKQKKTAASFSLRISPTSNKIEPLD